MVSGPIHVNNIWKTNPKIATSGQNSLMVYDYGIQYVHGQNIGHADTMSRLPFKDDGKHLVATVTATFEKPAIDIKLLQKLMATDHFNKCLIRKIRTGKRNNCTKLEKEIAKKANALTIQNHMI